MNRVAVLLDRLGRAVMENVEETGKIFLLFISVLAWMFRPPLKLRNIFKQMEFSGSNRSSSSSSRELSQGW